MIKKTKKHFEQQHNKLKLKRDSVQIKNEELNWMQLLKLNVNKPKHTLSNMQKLPAVVRQ